MPTATSTRATLADVLAEWGEGGPERRPVVEAIAAIATASVELGRLIAAAPTAVGYGDDSGELTAAETVSNASGDDQKPLDVLAEAHFARALSGLSVAAMCSEESADPIPLSAGGTILVSIDPIDGSSNIDINASIGTIFSIMPVLPGGDLLASALQPGRNQLAAGVIVYGPSTTLILTVGDGTDVFALDPATGEYVRTHRRVELPTESPEYAINASNARHWEPGIRSYVSDLVDGSGGPRGMDFNMRWLAALVADTYRILLRGGIYLYPRDERPNYRNGRIRLVYEANPVAFLCHQAGGLATDGIDPILDSQPTSLHQKTPLVFGSRRKVERVAKYLTEPFSSHEDSPLFNRRGLFRD
jgi:fructose-1,6-bisphosphatase I